MRKIRRTFINGQGKQFSENFTSVLKCCMVLFHQNIFLVKNGTQEFLAVLACFPRLWSHNFNMATVTTQEL